MSVMRLILGSLGLVLAVLLMALAWEWKAYTRCRQKPHTPET